MWLRRGPWDDVTVETRLGHNTQDVIPGFGDIYADLAVNKVLGWDYDDPGAEVGPWVQAQTYGNATQGLRVLLTAPQGLFHANDEGGLSYSTVYLDLEYQREGDDEWLPMTVANAELTGFDASTLYKARDAVSFGDGKCWCRSDMSFPSMPVITSFDGRRFWMLGGHALPTSPCATVWTCRTR